MSATTRPSAPSPTVDDGPVRAALERLARLAQVHDRPELVESCTGALRRLEAPACRVAVIGDYKQGKSSLVNGLIGAAVAAVDDDVATAARLEIGFREPAGARRWFLDDERDEIVDADVPIADAAAASADPRSTVVRVGLPRRLLRDGLVLVDTPGTGGITSAHAIATAGTLDDAHAVLFVTDVSQELTRAEADAVVDAARRCPRVIVVETKIDLSPQWRDIVEADREHVRSLGLEIPVLPISNHLRQLALAAEDVELNQESGFGPLVRMLREDVLEGARSIAVEGAMQTARRVYAHLRDPLVAELAALDGATDASLAEGVASTRRDLEAFGERARAWQQMLGDGISDLTAKVDVDLRDRFRELVREIEAELDRVDPDLVWHELEPALYRRTAEALDGNLAVLRSEASVLADRIASAIADDEEQRLDLEALYVTVEVDATADRQTGRETTSAARAQQAFRAGYGGAMPIMAVGGMALGVLGLGTLVLPLAAVAGVMAGRKAITDERDRRLTQRRQQAKLAVKRYTDEALFRAGAERKRAQRVLQRSLRDHFAGRVRELTGTYRAAVEQAERAARADAAERQARLAAVRDELARVEQVARELAGRR